MNEINGGTRRQVLGSCHSILLVEPEHIVRFSVAMFLNSVGSFDVKYEARSADEALAILENENPDLLITEVALPGRSGIDLLLELQRQNKSIKSLVLSSVDSPDSITQSLLAGARGFIPKDAHPEELVLGLRSIMSSSKRYLPRQIQHLAESSGSNYALSSKGANDPLESLSPREREIFHLLASGLQNTVIAKKLFISPRTVETHRARIVRKLNVSSNGELIRFAIKHGLSTL